MTRLSAHTCPSLPEPRRPSVEAVDVRSMRARLLNLVKLAVVGGLAFAMGLVAIVALRSFGWAAGLLVTVSGPVLIASVIERLYWG